MVCAPSGALVVDRLIGRGPEIEKDTRRTGGIPDALAHQDTDQLLLGIHVPGRAVATVPAITSGGRRQIVAPGHDGDAESPAVAVPEAGEETGHRLLLGSDVVYRHDLDRSSGQDALVPVLPPFQHHLAEGEEIVNRRDQPTGARLENGRACPPAVVDTVEDLELPGREIGPVAARQPVELARRHAKRGVVHAQRREDPLPEEVLQACTGYARGQYA